MNLDNETQSLIISAKLGNEEALNKLFARHQSRILRIVRLRLSSNLRLKLKLQSMDILQEVFIYAFQHLKDFEPQSQGHFLNWLGKKVEHYVCDRLDYVSTLKRDAPDGEVSMDQEITPGSETEQMKLQIKDDGTTPSQFAVRQERDALIDSLLDRLDPEQKEIIIHRDLEDMTFVEIGSLLGKAEDAVRKQYSRSFKKLIELAEEKISPIIAEQTYREFKNGI